MADTFDFPDTVLAAQVAFLAAEARCAATSSTAEFEATMEEMRQLAEQLNDYWATVDPGTRAAARAALRAAARAELAAG